jgi:4-alpha-glucanotransferase
VTAFAGANDEELLFHEFMQWLADRSLGIAQRRARDAGMRIGLIGDIAVGMDPAGSHAWGRQGDILLGLTVGAPPDLLNPRGQEWGLTSFSPRALVSGGFAPFIATLRAAMRQIGGVRIDHAMGLARLWLVPEGASPADGAYLEYPMPDLLRLLALESARNDAVVIGEDLGTVPGGFHDQLEQAGIHGMRVMWFEREPNNGFVNPRAWSRSAVAMTSTHDLPTVAGWWNGSDIRVRAQHNRLGEGVRPEQVQAERNEDRPQLWDAFVTERLAEGEPPSPDDSEPVVDAAVRFVARTEAPLCLVPVEDLLGETAQPNLPGTVDEYPNWRRRLPQTVDSVLDNEAVARRVAAVAAERPRQ